MIRQYGIQLEQHTQQNNRTCVDKNKPLFLKAICVSICVSLRLEQLRKDTAHKKDMGAIHKWLYRLV